MRDIVKHRCAQTTLPTTSATLSPWWGLNLAPLNPDLASYFGTQKGALVLSTDSRRYPGLKAGDVITDVNGTSVTTPMDVMRTLRGIATGSSVTWKVLRHHHVQTVTMKAPPTIWHISPMKLPFSGKPHATKVITYTQNNATP
ncbi:MAG TPA: PDZ domain-containing protein [Rhodanobacteraceae bacterium]